MLFLQQILNVRTELFRRAIKHNMTICLNIDY